jgi:hypothetical protein
MIDSIIKLEKNIQRIQITGKLFLSILHEWKRKIEN